LDAISSIIADEYITIAKQNPAMFSRKEIGRTQLGSALPRTLRPRSPPRLVPKGRLSRRLRTAGLGGALGPPLAPLWAEASLGRSLGRSLGGSLASHTLRRSPRLSGLGKPAKPRLPLGRSVVDTLP